MMFIILESNSLCRIVFMREFRKLKLTAAGILDKSEMEKSLAGDPFVPEYVYEAIRSSSRFSSMRVSLQPTILNILSQ